MNISTWCAEGYCASCRHVTCEHECHRGGNANVPAMVPSPPPRGGQTEKIPVPC